MGTTRPDLGKFLLQRCHALGHAFTCIFLNVIQHVYTLFFWF
jgi:hypothetical protein